METKIYTDQMGRRVRIPFPPNRIVSLVPSQTELLHYLGADVVGITKFCIHPSTWFRSKTRIGGTKQLHLDLIRSLSPDLIIANKEENDAAQVNTLMDEFPVWLSDIHTLSDALEMIQAIGDITDQAQKAAELNKQITDNFNSLVDLSENKRLLKAAYFIWKDPWMVAGGDTFINDMMNACGFENIFAGTSRYPEVPLEQLKEKGCELVLLSSEPYPFKDTHIAELQVILPGLNIILADGEMYSWYGSRLLQAPAYFRSLNNLINP